MAWCCLDLLCGVWTTVAVCAPCCALALVGVHRPACLRGHTAQGLHAGLLALASRDPSNEANPAPTVTSPREVRLSLREGVSRFATQERVITQASQ